MRQCVLKPNHHLTFPVPSPPILNVNFSQNLKAASTTNFELAATTVVAAEAPEVGLRGSDSGISMTSQQEQEIRELLNVPWDMPKLRKKTEQGRRNEIELFKQFFLARSSIFSKEKEGRRFQDFFFLCHQKIKGTMK